MNKIIIFSKGYIKSATASFKYTPGQKNSHMLIVVVIFILDDLK